MDIGMQVNPARRAVYYTTQSSATKEKRQPTARASRAHDSVEISPEARAAVAKGGVAAAVCATALSTVKLPAFDEAYASLVRDFDQTVRTHYGEAHQENLTFDDPAHHIWEKYKDQSSDYFRSDLSELERDWAYDQEMDLVRRGGKNMNLTDPFAYQDGAPSFASAVVQANQTVRNQMDQTIGRLFRRAGVPEDAILRLTVDAKDHRITISGLDDEALTTCLEEALNEGDNGKSLYEHIRLCDPAPFGGAEQEQYVPGSPLSLDYRDGHLMDLDGAYGYGPDQRDWQSTASPRDDELQAFQETIGTEWTRLWGAYDPQLGPLDNWSFMHAQGVDYGKEWEDRTEAGIRATMPALVERVKNDPRFSMREQMAELERRAREMQGLSTMQSPGTARSSGGSEKLDPETRYKVGIKAYMDSMVTQWQEEEEAIKSYYAAGISENQRFSDPIAHIARKYCAAFSASNLLYFRADLSLTARKIAARQEYSIMMGGSIKHNDPYALASIGGAKTAQQMDAIARKYAESVLAAMEQKM